MSGRLRRHERAVRKMMGWGGWKVGTRPRRLERTYFEWHAARPAPSLQGGASHKPSGGLLCVGKGGAPSGECLNVVCGVPSRARLQKFPRAETHGGKS